MSKTMFQRVPTAPTTAAKPAAQVDPIKAKEVKWGAHQDVLLQELADMAAGGGVIVYTDGSAKRVRGWIQAGFGVWFGDAHPRNFHRMFQHTNGKASVGETCGECCGHCW